MFPGNNIPDWFGYQSETGSISIDLASRLYGKPVELYFGAVFELDKAASNTNSGSGIFSCVYEVTINDKKTLIIARNFESLEMSHVWLSKMKFGHFMWPFSLIAISLTFHLGYLKCHQRCQ